MPTERKMTTKTYDFGKFAKDAEEQNVYDVHLVYEDPKLKGGSFETIDIYILARNEAEAKAKAERKERRHKAVSAILKPNVSKAVAFK